MKKRIRYEVESLNHFDNMAILGVNQQFIEAGMMLIRMITVPCSKEQGRSFHNLTVKRDGAMSINSAILVNTKREIITVRDPHIVLALGESFLNNRGFAAVLISSSGFLLKNREIRGWFFQDNNFFSLSREEIEGTMESAKEQSGLSGPYPNFSFADSHSIIFEVDLLDYVVSED